MIWCPHCGHAAPVVLRSWSTFIEAKVKSANATRSNHGAAHFAYATQRNEWTALWLSATWMCSENASVRTSTVRRHVTFTRHYTGREREMDHANMVGGMKGPVDAMVRAGLLVDDSPKWLEATYLQLRSDRSGLAVRIEEHA